MPQRFVLSIERPGETAETAEQLKLDLQEDYAGAEVTVTEVNG